MLVRYFLCTFNHIGMNIDSSHTILVCNLQDKKDWHVTTFHGAWVEGYNAGGCGQPPNEGE